MSLFIYGVTPNEVLERTVHTVMFYHLPDIKIGATKDPKRRHQQNLSKYGEIHAQPLFEFTGTVLEIAEKENELSLLHGYGEIDADERYDSIGNLYYLFSSKLPWETPSVRTNSANRKAWMNLPFVYQLWRNNDRPAWRELRRLCMSNGLPNVSYDCMYFWFRGDHNHKGGMAYLLSEHSKWIACLNE